MTTGYMRQARSETDNISRGTSISSYSREEDKGYTM